ncbi:MAG: hypothetical protein ACJ780_28730 [Solirubrobacteraceae bacterium]
MVEVVQRRLDLRGALLATARVAALVDAASEPVTTLARHDQTR